MLRSFSEFKFYQSFRIPVETADELRFLIEKRDKLGKTSYIEDAKLVDISVTGLGFKTKERISVSDEMSVSLQFKKHHLDLTGSIVRAFSGPDDHEIIYGIELDEDAGLKKLLEQYVTSFSMERLKECLVDSALKDRYAKASDGLEMFSLLLSLFKDITFYGDKEGFLENMLEEVVRIMNANRASIFLINPDTNELEAVCALGVEKEQLKFDYRLGIAGSVFTTGVALNIDTINDRSRFNEKFDKWFGFETKSIICHPIHNREDKIIGAIEVLNKRNQDRFTVEDEKTMKVIALVFSSVFYRYNPISETSLIRRFSTPFDREYAMIGKTPHIMSLRNSILKTKDLDFPMLIEGEPGVGKALYAKIIHFEGGRGLKRYEEVDCRQTDKDLLAKELWGNDEESKLAQCQGGTLLIREINQLSLEMQRKLIEVLEARRIPDSKLILDTRVLATTSMDLGKMVAESKFEKKLFDYLSKSYVFIEPLRRRVDDVALLVDYFLKLECKKQGLLLKSFGPKAIDRLRDYDWPGNISELKRCIERSVLYNPKTHVITEVELTNEATPVFDVAAKRRSFGDIPFVYDFHLPLKDRMALVELEMIKAEIKRNSGNKSKAAKEMGISREALRKKLNGARALLKDLQERHKENKAVAKAALEFETDIGDDIEKAAA